MSVELDENSYREYNFTSRDLIKPKLSLPANHPCYSTKIQRNSSTSFTERSIFNSIDGIDTYK